MKLNSPWIIKPHTTVRLADYDASTAGSLSEAASAAVVSKQKLHLAKLQNVLYAGRQKAILIILQGMDTAGKDGTISHIFSGINPQGCDVSSFKVPTEFEARHDFLWRCHQAVPAKGMIGIFNRSHYEDVLSPRVHKLISAKDVRQRLDDINHFEAMLAESGVVILKFFLHISHDEQKRRLQARFDDPEKHWKFSDADLRERQFWPAYESAYENILSHTSRKYAPWFIIPANHKHFRNLTISTILVGTIKRLKLAYPKPTMDFSKIKL